MWLSRALKWLLPKEDHFFDLLERGSDCALQSAVLLVECCEAPRNKDRKALVGKIGEAEHVADLIIHEVYESLNKTFVTPLDRSDIYTLSTQIENITDTIHATISHIIVHDLDEMPEGSQELARLIKDACTEIHAAVGLLRGLKNLDEVRVRCKRLNSLESDGDKVYQMRLSKMFKNERDAIRLLKHKEFLEGLERTLDACDDVGNALETIVIKNV